MSVKFVEWIFGGAVLGSADTQSLHLCFIHEKEKIVDGLFHYSKLSTALENGKFHGLVDEKIQKICVYRQGSGKSRSYHAFTVLKTKNFYYSIDRVMDFISIQRSAVMNDVVQNYNLKQRRGTISQETNWAEGKGSVWDIIDLLLKTKTLEKRFNYFIRNCQELAAKIYKNFNTQGLKLKKYQQQKSLPAPVAVPVCRADTFTQLKNSNKFSGISKVFRLSKLLSS